MGMGGAGGGKSRTTMSEINVTPLVDVMLVLLIMFMVTAPMMQQGIEVDLPKTSPTGMNVPADEPYILVINGNRQISVAKNNIRFEDLQKKLRATFKNRKDKILYVQADRQVDYGYVAEVINEAKAAGLDKVGLVTVDKNMK